MRRILRVAVGLSIGAAGLLVLSGAQAGPGGASATAVQASSSAASSSAVRYVPDRFAGRAGAYYLLVWGIDSIKVRWAESGELIRFSWRVRDPAKAAVLNNKQLEPTLLDPQAGVSLVVPSMEKVGQLRQSAPPEAGKSYWMAFSNKGRRVKRGDRVDVVIGPFHAQWLVVD